MDRRKFLHLAGLGLLAAGCSRSQSAAVAGSAAEERASAASPVKPNAEAAGGPGAGGRPRVVVVRGAWALGGADEADRLRGALARGIVALTGSGSADKAWAQLFDPDENVAIKVNCLAGPALCSSPALVEALVEALTASGHERGRLWVYDRTTAELEECGFRISRARDDVKCLGTDEVGYEVDVTVSGSVGTQFSQIIAGWADAIINVPVGKDHDLAGISGALKNHLGSINNPNKLHFPDLSLAIADVNMAPQVRGKQRLVVCDLRKVCYEGGPGFKPGTTKPYGAIMLARDPVAADAVLVKIIDGLRADAGLSSLWQRKAKPRHIKIAGDEEHRLGCAELDKIEVVEVEA